MFLHYDHSVNRKKQLFICFFCLAISCFTQRAFSYSMQEVQRQTSAKEAQLFKLREAEIEQLKLVLSRSTPREQRADLLLRLSELYTEKYKFYFFKENEIWQRQMDAYLSQSLAKQKYTRRPKPEHNLSQRWLHEATSTLQQILSIREHYPKMDEVYYFLGFNLWEQGKKSQALPYFAKIIREHPHSKFSTEANRYLGEDAFAKRKFHDAMEYYKHAAAVDSPSRSRILYGLAWSYYKQKNYRKALDTMSDAIQVARGQTKEAAKNGVNLYQDAYDALVLFYSEGGQVQEATSYFNEVLGHDAASDSLRKLATLFQRQGKYSKALAINKQLLAMGAEHKEAGGEQRFEILMDGLRVASDQDKRNQEIILLKQLVREFITAKAATEEQKEAIQKTLRKTALLMHQEANKSKSAESLYQQAVELYRLYLSAFAADLKEDDFYEIHYYLGDVLSQLEQHEAAAQEFKLILEAAINKPQIASLQKNKKNAAEGLVFSYDQALKRKLNNAEVDRLLSAIDLYIRVFPSDNDSIRYLYRGASALVENKRMPEAEARLLQLIHQYPKSKEAFQAAALLVKEAEKENNWDKAMQFAKEFLAIPALLTHDEGKFRNQLQDVISRAQFKNVKGIEEDKNYPTAAKQYEDLAKSAKDQEVRFKALNNAAVNYHKAGDEKNEIRILLTLLRSYSDKDLVQNNFLAKANERFFSGEYADAASLLEQFYDVYEDKITSLNKSEQKVAINAIKNAAYLWQALHRDDKANEDFQKIVIAANKKISIAINIAEESLFKIADRLQKSGKTEEAVQNLNRYLKAFPDGPNASEAMFRLGEMYRDLREDQKAKSFFDKIVRKAQGGAKSDANRFAAHAKIIQLSNLENEYRNAELHLPEKQLKADINRKLTLLDKLNKAYLEVVNLGDGHWGLEALYRTSLVYQDFAEKLEAVPAPAELSNEDKAKFKAQLQNIAKPIYAKVQDTLSTALKRGEDLKVIGDVMAQIYIRSSLLNPSIKQYPLIQELSWDAKDWLMGDTNISNIQKIREQLQADPTQPGLLLMVGNWHLIRGETDFAKIFYLKSLDAAPTYVPAINNLAFLRGIEGEIPEAFSGFQQALKIDEFAYQPKINSIKIAMASGLWKLALIGAQQLEVRFPGDDNVKKLLALSYLATGKINQYPKLKANLSGYGRSAHFAQAILALAEGKDADAKNKLQNLAAEDRYATMILELWKK